MRTESVMMTQNHSLGALFDKGYVGADNKERGFIYNKKNAGRPLTTAEKKESADIGFDIVIVKY